MPGSALALTRAFTQWMHSERPADLGEGRDGAVEVLRLVGRGHLGADARLRPWARPGSEKPMT